MEFNNDNADEKMSLLQRDDENDGDNNTDSVNVKKKRR